MVFRRRPMSSAFSATELPAARATPLPWPRALQTSESRTNFESSLSISYSSMATTTSSTVATSSRPFFQDSTEVTPPPSPSSSQNPIPRVHIPISHIAIYLLLTEKLAIRIVFKRRNSASPFWSSRHNISPSDTDPPALPRRFPRTTGLTQVPPYPYSRRTRALDTDAAGRRILHTINTSDHDGYIGDKDVLPAYDNSGGPPQYREVALELNAIHTTGTRNAGVDVGMSSENSTGSGHAGDPHPPARDLDNASTSGSSRDPHLLSGSERRSVDMAREPESLMLPSAVHVHQ
ncbi:hypothetical protein C0995_013701 [Termitomyces sp. Mi166|nr:hypothetical protein C0995_013701 [Termitomyces sp. Mi166\